MLYKKIIIIFNSATARPLLNVKSHFTALDPVIMKSDFLSSSVGNKTSHDTSRLFSALLKL